MTRIRTYARVALGLLAAGTLFLGCNDKDEDRAKTGTAGTTGAAVTTQAGITPTGQVSYVFSSSVAGNGSGTIAITPAPGPGDLIPAGTVVTVTPTAAPGSRFDGWGGDFAGNIDNPLRLTMARDTVLIANFIIPPPGVPTAAFTHTPDPAMWIAPLDVTFTDGSSDQPTSWLWDFGDGVTSTLPNPTHTYTRAGTYTVTLEVSNAVGTSLALVKRDLIEVAPATAGSRYWYQGDVYGNPFKVHTGAEAGFAQQVLTLVNQERTSRGLNALQWDAEAERAAKAHADDMQARNYFSHVSPEGWSPGDRLVWTGATGYSNYAENIAWGQRDPAAVMVAWMNSPGHRANILDPSFTHLGVGVANPQPYWVQVFLTR